VANGEARPTQKLILSGHNGPVFDLVFSPDGTVLASASGDETIKLWRVSDGLRLDTLSQPQGEQYTVAFSPDGRYVVGGGADNRIRVWQFLSRDQPRINPLVFARFAHEGAIVEVAFSSDGQTLVSAADDRTLKAWQTATYTETKLFEPQSDVITSLAVSPSGQSVVVGLLDGNWRTYPIAAPAAVAQAAASPGEASPGQRDAAADESGDAEQTDLPTSRLAESEPNDRPSQAMPIAVPAEVKGIIYTAQEGQGEDGDLYSFDSAAGDEWVIEINAARQDSPLDSFVEVLDSEGRSIERVALQAVRDSYFTFRGKDSFTSDDFRVQNWEEMKLNQYLYAGGEVVKLWLYPRGPDSGFMVYPGEGNRYTYFGTTPGSHALGEPCYIVEPHPPGTRLIPNGLPVFTVYYENDDDSRRAWGTDSRLSFVAPQDGTYLVRVSDARGFGGDDFTYELTVRPRQPDFSVKLENREVSIGRGSGQEFRVTADRRDGFEGAIRIEIDGLPDGVTATSPIVIEPGQIAAFGTISAASDAPSPSAEQWQRLRIRAVAEIQNTVVQKQVDGFTRIELAESPQVLVQILPATAEQTASGEVPASAAEGPPPAPPEELADAGSLELTIRPGETIAARVRLIRRGFDGEVSLGGFDAGRNLPHGVYVDNIGLNGLTILAGQSERVFFITADDWVGPQRRTFHLKANAAGNPTSLPVVLRVE
jgi:hypothetical protein